ncbi:MAG: hypothetical protein R3C61_25195 [Bacteroidia bacterium]
MRLTCAAISLRFKSGFLLLWLWVWEISMLMSQCCSPGNPVGGMTIPGNNRAEMWQLLTSYRYGYSGRYFEGSQPVAPTFIRSGNYQHLAVLLAYGLTDKLTIDLESGYFLNKTQLYAPGIIPEKLSGKGFTDLTLQVRGRLLQNSLKDIEISSGAGLKIPVGSHEQKDGGLLLPQDLQPTTGSFDFVHSLFLYRGFLSDQYRVFFSTRTELRGLNPDGYRYGHLFLASGFFSWSPHYHWTFIQQLRTELRGRDTRPDTGSGIPTGSGREKVIPTGSVKFFAIPQLTFSPQPEVHLSILCDLPLYQYYHDRQLATTTAVTLSLRTEF